MIRLKELRNKIKYTQKDVAKYLGISQPAYANYESGSRQADYETLSMLATLFNVSVDYILGRTDEPSVKSLDEQLEGIDFALYGETKELSETQKQDVLKFIKFLKSKDEG